MNRIVYSLLMLIFTAPCLQAAVVVWSSETFTDASQILTTGTLVEASNLGQGEIGANGASPTASVTLNGVVFSSVSGSQYTDATAVGTFRNVGNYTGPEILGLTTDETEDLLDTLEFGGGAGNSTVTLSGLQPGLEYAVQVLLSRNQNPGGTIDLGHALAPGGAEVYTELDIPVGAGVGASVATGLFTADSSTQELHFSSSVASNAEINALQLRIIPEPDSVLLLGVAASFGLRRRR
ncbi:MAG: PEP-CTERM sorting domain-containing protein [Verrucomicrobiota bacterium]